MQGINVVRIHTTRISGISISFFQPLVFVKISRGRTPFNMIKHGELIQKLIDANKDPYAKELVPLFEEIAADNFEEIIRFKTFFQIPIESIARIINHYTNNYVSQSSKEGRDLH